MKIKETNKKAESENSDDMLQFVTEQLYKSLTELHEQLAVGLGEKEANDLIVNAISINLGHIIGQLNVKDQKKYSRITRQTIKDHTLLGTIAKDEHLFGRIGRA